VCIIDLKWGSQKTGKLCRDPKKALRELGQLVAEKLLAAIQFLESATTLRDVLCMPIYHLHTVGGKRKSQLAMDLGRKIGYRLIIKPDPPWNEEEEKLDLSSKCQIVSCIIILEVTNHYA